MNRVLTTALLAGGLLLLDAPEAAAHKELRTLQQPWAHYSFETRRAKHLPRWLRRNQSFRSWYRHSRLRKNRYLSWHELFDIYRWERVQKRRIRHGRLHFHDHGYFRDFESRERRKRWRH